MGGGQDKCHCLSVHHAICSGRFRLSLSSASYKRYRSMRRVSRVDHRQRDSAPETGFNTSYRTLELGGERGEGVSRGGRGAEKINVNVGLKMQSCSPQR